LLVKLDRVIGSVTDPLADSLTTAVDIFEQAYRQDCSYYANFIFGNKIIELEKKHKKIALNKNTSAPIFGAKKMHSDSKEAPSLCIKTI
jgi:hypothetical protein